MSYFVSIRPAGIMSLLDLPTEILRSVIEAYYEPWSLHVRRLPNTGSLIVQLEVLGLPDRSLLYTCKDLYDIAIEMENNNFIGELSVEETTAQMGVTCDSLLNSIRSPHKLRWIKENVKTIKFSNKGFSPNVWSFPKQLSWMSAFSALELVELDCRYPYHFAMHNVESMTDFLANKEDRLTREMDYRHAFFLRCEKFLFKTTSGGIPIRVVRSMGVREGSELCQAVVSLNEIRRS